jgi:hypothetical protein
MFDALDNAFHTTRSHLKLKRFLSSLGNHPDDLNGRPWCLVHVLSLSLYDVFLVGLLCANVSAEHARRNSPSNHIALVIANRAWSVSGFGSAIGPDTRDTPDVPDAPVRPESIKPIRSSTDL